MHIASQFSELQLSAQSCGFIARFLISPHLKKLLVLGLLIANVVDEFKKDKEIIELRNS